VQPLIVTHTGVTGQQPHWRNIDDAQIKAVAATAAPSDHLQMLSSRRQARGRIVDHMQHIVDVAGDDFISLGSDWDA